MRTLAFETADGRATVYVGDAADFAENDDVPAAVLGPLRGTVAWIEWIEAARPRSGNALLEDILAELHAQGVGVVGAHVVPVGVAADAPAVRRLAAFYSRHGFTDVSAMVPGSEWPAMVALLGEKPDKHVRFFRLLDDRDGSNMLGQDVSEANVYVRTYGKLLPNEKRPEDLLVGESTRKRYSLSGTKPTVYRILRVS